ncbi:unnamed protein product, partial [Didymodactylos carnosus]
VAYQCALSWFEKALQCIQPDNIYRAIIYFHIGTAYSSKYEDNTALDYYNKALNYEQEINSFDLASLYEAFSSVCCHMGNLDDALDYLNRALDIHGSNPSNQYAHAQTYISMALMYEAKLDQNKALQSYQCVLNILLERVPKNHPRLALMYAKVGEIHSKCGSVSYGLLSKSAKHQENNLA